MARHFNNKETKERRRFRQDEPAFVSDERLRLGRQNLQDFLNHVHLVNPVRNGFRQDVQDAETTGILSFEFLISNWQSFADSVFSVSSCKTFALFAVEQIRVIRGLTRHGPGSANLMMETRETKMD
jgi:hypothetical protein